MEINVRLLGVLKERFKERNLTLTEVAERMETTHTSVSRKLNGHNQISMDDLAGFANVLGTPMSTLLKEAEHGGKVRISEELERHICSDPRIYAIFVALNFPTTVEALVSSYGLEKKFVQTVVDRFKKERIVFHPGPGLLQLTDMGKDISFGTSREFYDLKARVYAIGSAQTYANLSRGREFWADKDDTMLVARLTPPQVLSVAKQFESLAAQVRTMDQMNSAAKSDDPASDRETQLKVVFMGLKPFNKELILPLMERSGK